MDRVGRGRGISDCYTVPIHEIKVGPARGRLRGASFHRVWEERPALTLALSLGEKVGVRAGILS